MNHTITLPKLPSTQHAAILRVLSAQGPVYGFELLAPLGIARGSLYVALQRLITAGFVSATATRRRRYAITDAGRQVLDLYQQYAELCDIIRERHR